MDLTFSLGHALTLGAVALSGGVTIGMLRATAQSFREHEKRDREDFTRAQVDRAQLDSKISDLRADVARLEVRR